MRNLLALVGAGTVTFVGLGWYMGWYKVERQPAPSGYQRLQVDINPKKITEDVRTGVERGAEFVSHFREHVPETPPANVPRTGTPNPVLPGAAQPAPAAPAPAAPSSGLKPIGNPAPPTDDTRRFSLPPLPGPG